MRPRVRRTIQAMRAKYVHEELEHAEVVIPLGGDGTMLKLLQKIGDRQRDGLPVPAIFGMNLGHVGFLMNKFDDDRLIERIRSARRYAIHPLEMDVVCCVSAGGRPASRSPQRTGQQETQTSVSRETPPATGRRPGSYLAYNEISVHRRTAQAACFSVHVDGIARIKRLYADGLLVSTPAGSTAYNQSAGGPIIPLNGRLLALTSINPFRPRWRGALLDAAAEVEFRVLESKKRPVYAVADNQELDNIASVFVRESPLAATLLFDANHDLEEKVLKAQFAHSL